MARWDTGVVWHPELVTPPDEEPLKVEFVRDKHLRVTNGSVEDDYIQRLIRVTRIEGERFTGRAWMTQVWKMVLDRFPCGYIEVPLPPLQSVDAITYVDADGATQTLATNLYQYTVPNGPHARRGRIAPAYGEVWPATRCDTLAAVEVAFTAGYVDATVSPQQPNVPEDLVHGQLLAIAELYKQRSESVIGVGTTINPAFRTARALWGGYRVY